MMNRQRWGRVALAMVALVFTGCASAGTADTPASVEAESAESSTVLADESETSSTTDSAPDAAIEVTVADGLPVEDITCGRLTGNLVRCAFWVTNTSETLSMLTYRGVILDANGDILGDFGNTDINVEPGQRIRGSAAGLEPEGFEGATASISFDELVIRDQP